MACGRAGPEARAAVSHQRLGCAGGSGAPELCESGGGVIFGSLFFYGNFLYGVEMIAQWIHNPMCV